MTPPNFHKGVCKIRGLVHFYCNMWAIISHTLALLTKLRSSKVNSKWTEIEQKPFE